MSKVTKPKAGVKHIKHDNFLTYYESPSFAQGCEIIGKRITKQVGDAMLGKPLEQWIEELAEIINNEN